jgi:KDO2-lipid IV(A) lauroyltransferase
MSRLKRVASSPSVLKLGMLLSRRMPEGIRHRFAWWGAGLISQLKPGVYEVVRDNLSQVMGADVGAQELGQTVRRVFYTSVRGYLDLFRGLQLPRADLATLIEVPESARAVARTLRERAGGTVLVFPHLGSFDLGGHALAPLVPEMRLFTLPDPPPGFQLLNELRGFTGVTVTPLSATALRESIKLLRRGGVVSVAVDRPVSDLDDPVPFFGRPARVPSAHVRMALKTNAVITVAYTVFSQETQKHIAYLEPPMELIRTGNRQEEIQLNMRQVLDSIERIIRTWPEQWQMFVPVWPGVQGA